MAGGLLTWAHTFIGDEVNHQFTMQDITMPSGAALAALPAADRAALSPYAGSRLNTGPEAKAYADHYILAHLNEMSGGKTYSTVSGQFVAMTPAQQASPAGVKLGQLRETMFMGDTLRGLLLYGYAFATIGTIAGLAAIAAFLGAAVLALLALLGLWHASRATQTERLPGRSATPSSPATPLPVG